MSRMNQKDSSATEIIDGFVNYKLNRYKSKLDNVVKKIKGEVVCNSDIIMEDILEPQYLVNALSDKILDRHSFLLHPFKHTYPLNEIKHAITDRLSMPTDQSMLGGIPNDLVINSKPRTFRTQTYFDVKKSIDGDVDAFLLKESREL